MLKRIIKAFCMVVLFISVIYNMQNHFKITIAKASKINSDINSDIVINNKFTDILQKGLVPYKQSKLLKETDMLNELSENLYKQQQEAIKIEQERITKEAETARLEAARLEAEKVEEESKNIEFILTFYTSLACENSSAGPIDCLGRPLQSGIASNYYKLGTNIKLEGYGTLEVRDKGGANFSNNTRLDVFIARNEGEGDDAYSRRVNNMGIVKVRGRVIE